MGLEDLARPIGSVAHGSNETLGKNNSGSYAPMSNACDHLGMISVCVSTGRTANLDARGRQWVPRIWSLVLETASQSEIFCQYEYKTKGTNPRSR